ncbi:expressed unknown protein [Seminavis robusta]|uniref:F-box domain-containing protein n=1 Tax=Seminavis robusta TaxID=568900 RepID=A0A9N8HPT6_9STRA|nr:expressed unknown protein [Seminavis robusta]|eukprot:Sro1126_g244050.1 n/a (479) ;mRNA; r:5892-7328
MGNHCCRALPFLTGGRRSAMLDDRDLVDWRVLGRGADGTSSSVRGDDNGNSSGLTIILNLLETSKIERTTAWLRSNSHVIRHVLMGRPRRPNDDDDAHHQQQPNWSSEAMRHLFEAIGDIPKLEVLLMNEVGSAENPIPIRFLSQALDKRHSLLKQAYLSGHFDGNLADCELFASRISQQPQLQCFALYGNAQREFTLDPILQAVAALPTLRDLHFHANMPHPITSDTVLQVARIAQLEKLTIHSCDITGDNMATLATTLVGTATCCLRELTVFEAFAPNFAQQQQLPISNHASLEALTYLLKHSPSLRKVQIWFGFAADSQILIPFATQSLTHNPRITHFNTALLWTPKYYDEDVVETFVTMLAHHNTSLQHLRLYKYTGRWRLALYFYIRLNQTGRRAFVNTCEQMTTAEWIDTVLTAIPPLVASPSDPADDNHNDTSFLEQELLDGDDWFQLSWIYYYMRLQPSIIETAVATAKS